MNRGTLRWLGSFAALALAAGPLVADPLRVEALSLEPDVGWLRGPAAQEREDDAYILDHQRDSADGSQLVLLRRAPRVREGAEAYFDKLARYWRATYGRAVLVDWLELGGIRWRYLRRPARENGQGLFQLYTVVDDRAYGLLVFVPGTATTLPAAARKLIEGIRFDAAAPPRWVRQRTYRLNVTGDALEAVAATDAERSGRDGLLTGYGLNYGENSVEWFLEGYQWKVLDGRVDRLTWTTRGRLEVVAPAELDDTEAWTLRLILPEGDSGIVARLAVHDLCGEAETVREVLERIHRGVRGGVERLAATCPGPAPVAPAIRLKGIPDQTAQTSLAVPAAPANGVHTRLVEVVVEPGPDRVLPGDGLLRRARLFYAYEPRRDNGYLSSK